MEVLGRNREKRQLDLLLESEKSEFVVVYGRRRIGKTYLIRNYLEKKISLYVTGLKDGNKQQQLKNFYNELLKKHKLKKGDSPANNWADAFLHLEQYLAKQRSKKKVIFFDEIPWMSTAKSDFLSALDHFWNHWASARNDIVLIACGSAASWVINKLLKSKGGLHNRVTQRIKLNPFTLYETELFLSKHRIKISRYELVKLYMILGGVPFYLSLLDRRKSIPRNIDELCFTDTGILRNEYNELYHSLFNDAAKHLKIIGVLGKKAKGLSRDEVLKFSGLANGGTATKVLDELEESGFIHKYIPVGKKSRDAIYKLADFFSLFHLKFMNKEIRFDTNFWASTLNTASQNTWAGFTFELLCFLHTEQIKTALGISGIKTYTAVWSNAEAQADLIIERADNVVNLLEIKFYNGPFTITKSYYHNLLNKIAQLQLKLSKKQAVQLVLLTTFGLSPSVYNDSVVSNIVEMDALFIPHSN